MGWGLHDNVFRLWYMSTLQHALFNLVADMHRNKLKAGLNGIPSSAVWLQCVLFGDLCLADGNLHRIHGGICHLWLCCGAQDVHQKQLGSTSMLYKQLGYCIL